MPVVPALADCQHPCMSPVSPPVSLQSSCVCDAAANMPTLAEPCNWHDSRCTGRAAQAERSPAQRRARTQAGTSHELGDNFARAFGTRFLDEAGALVHVQQTSWGASTRLIGGIIMAHGESVLILKYILHPCTLTCAC